MILSRDRSQAGNEGSSLNSLQASVEDYRDVLVALFAEVALNYTDVRSLQNRIEIAVQNVEIQTNTLN